MEPCASANRPQRLRACARPLALLAVATMTAGVGGCAGGLLGQSGPTAPERLDATFGMAERDVISRWGTPDGAYDYADGGRAATWEHSWWDALYEDYFGCEITLEIDGSGTVTDWAASYVPNHAQPCHAIMDGEA